MRFISLSYFLHYLKVPLKLIQYIEPGRIENDESKNLITFNCGYAPFSVNPQNVLHFCPALIQPIRY